MARQLSLFDDMPEVAVSKRKGVATADRLNDYDGFTAKFEPKKTTDDCYTPPAVYDAVVAWCRSEGLIDDSTPIVRPFYPGGDFELETYPDGCAVIDNPPFSIYAKVVRWFIAQEIPFLLFGPQLTLKVRGADVCYLPVNASITYENGAVVNTGFVTSMLPGVRIWTAPSLHRMVTAAQPAATILPKNTYPLHVLNCALLGKVSCREVDFKVLAEDCAEIEGNLYSLAKVGKSLFGGGWLLSERAAAERAAAERAAAERAAAERAAAERAAGICVQLSESEWNIIKSLGHDDHRD